MIRKLSILILLILFTGCQSSTIKQIRQAEYRYSQGEFDQIEQIAAYLNLENESSVEAAYTLGRLGDPRATKYLVEVIERRGYAVNEAIKALGMLQDLRTIPVLIQVVKNDFPEAVEAVRVLGTMNDKRAIPILMQVVDERRPYFITAIEALGELGDKRALDMLVDALRQPPVDESRNIQFRIIGRQSQDESDKKQILTFQVPNNLPPKIHLSEEIIQPEGFVLYRYTLSDTEYDSLGLTAEFSVNNGQNWHLASTEGRIEGISVTQYQGSLIWRADNDNIPLEPQTRLLFKLTPTDMGSQQRKGVPEIRSYSVDSTAIAIKDVTVEESGDIPIKIFYPRSERAVVDSFAYHFSTDNGTTWVPATVRQGLELEEAHEDTMLIAWSSDVDLPNRDEPNVLFRISENYLNTIGSFDISAPMHVDNNAVPTVEFLNMNDANFFEIGYTVQDAEQDTVSLSVFYSTDRGRSWQPTTLSGQYANLAPDQYSGTLRWYSSFDVINDRESIVRLRIRPSDNDPGQFTDSPDFYLKDSDYSKLTQGLESGFIELMYPIAEADSVMPVGEFSTDGGRTWRPATLANLEELQIKGKSAVKVNWNFPQDVARNLMQIEAIGRSLEKIRDPQIVPELLYIVRQLSSPSRVRRQQAIEVNRILDNMENWVVEGLVGSLVHQDVSIQQQSYNMLKDVDRPEVAMAITDYQKYWNDLRRSERELNNRELQREQQEYIRSITEVAPPSQEQIVDFLMTKGMTRTRSERFIKQIDVMKEKQVLKEQYEAGNLSYDQYMDQLQELLEQARLQRERDLEADRRKNEKKKNQ